MIGSEIDSAGKAVIYLAACALHNKSPGKEVINSLALDEVLKQSVRHSMGALTYMAVSAYVKEHGNDAVSPELLAKWKRYHDMILRKLVRMSLERERLFGFLEENEIWYMPLKGTVLLDYYPRLGMRQMSDNDILMDSEKRVQVHDFMISNGYAATHYQTDDPDTYIKDGMLVFEMHHKLYSGSNSYIEDYYGNVERRLMSDGGYKRKFSNEDFYIYNVAHAYKHFISAGNGIRSLMDVYILRRRFAERFNREYVSGEIEKLEMTYYEKTVGSIAMKLFSEKLVPPDEYEGILSEEELEILDYHIKSGVFGVSEILIRNRLQRFDTSRKITFFSKIKYMLDRMFPSVKYYERNYPRAYKNKLLIPFYWFYRLFKGVKNRKKISREIKTVLKFQVTED